MSLPAHSPLGASGAERWMHCPGSVTLLNLLSPSERVDEPDYLKEGTAAHEAVAHVLANPDLETWEITGQTFGDNIVATPEFVKAVDVMVSVCRKLITPAVAVYIEHKMHRPEVHPLFFGTVDFATASESLLNVVDYKHGEGVLVEVTDPQFRYYAYGLVLAHPGVRRVVIRVVQPRAVHPDGPVRRWECTAEDLCAWANDELVPAMARANESTEFDAGSWCRFCPAKLICPLMGSLFEAASNHDPKAVNTLSDEVLGRSFRLIDAVHMYTKALREEVHRRNMSGKKIPGTKVVAGKGVRVWKDGAERALKAKLGEEIYDVSLRSPAQLEDLGPEAKMLTKQWAYLTPGGPTTVLESDRRTALRVKTMEEQYAHVLGLADGVPSREE